MELLGLFLAVIGIVFAFERPRSWLISLFRKSEMIEHSLGFRLHLEMHNDGKPLDPSGHNKSSNYRVFYWNIRNRSAVPIQLESGIILRQQNKGMPVVTLQLPQCTDQFSLLPKHRLELFEIVLTNSEIEHLRHWVKEGNAIGIRTTDGAEHWVPDSQYAQLREALQNAAVEAGLPAEVPPGQLITLRFKPAESLGENSAGKTSDDA